MRLCCPWWPQRQTQFQRLQAVCTDNQVSVQLRLDTAQMAVEREGMHLAALAEERYRVLVAMPKPGYGDPALTLRSRNLLLKIGAAEKTANKTRSIWKKQQISCVRELYKVNQSVTQLQILVSNKAEHTLMGGIKQEDLQLLGKSTRNRARMDDRRGLLFDAIATAMEPDDEDELEDEIDDEDGESLAINASGEQELRDDAAVDDIIANFCALSLPDVPDYELHNREAGGGGVDPDHHRQQDELSNWVGR
jgi:hypothetical protein